MEIMESLGYQKKKNNVRLLGQAIDSFNGAALTFERYYQHLEQRVRELNLELTDKNNALEINLQEKEEVKNYLNNILESITSGVLAVDLKGRIATFNKAAESITGLCSTDIMGKKFDEVFGPIFFRSSRSRFKSINEMKQNKNIETEIKKKGENVYVSISISTVKNHRGEEVGTIFTMQDITRMKKLEEQDSRNNRLAAMGEMAATMAHEIRNPIGSIELFATILRKKLADRKELREFAEHISSGVKSIDTIISNLLLFISPQQKPDFEIIDIHDPLNDSLFFSSHLIKTNDGIEVVSDYTSQPVMVNADPEFLKQVFLNIILNAIQAMPDGGKISISTEKGNDISSGIDSVAIKISDTGIGISKTDVPRIFDPFFTTKKRGTGLGLSIVHNLIKMHGGTIDIDSSGEEGTRVVVTLPLWEGKNG